MRADRTRRAGHDEHRQPVQDSRERVANVHSVSAIGEQYVDLVSTGNVNQYLRDGQTIATGTVPSEIGPALDAANRGLAVLPKDKIDSLLTEASQAVGGLGPALQRLVDSTTAIASDFRDNLNPVNDIIAHSAPILDSQVNSGDAIEAWSANLNSIGAQAAEQDAALRSGLQQAAPTADQLNAVFSDVQDSLPQTLANLEIVIDMLKRYHNGVEQALVILPQGAVDRTGRDVDLPRRGPAALRARLDLRPVARACATGFGSTYLGPPCLTGFLPASEVALAGRHHDHPAAVGHVLQDPEGLPGQRGPRCA